MSGNLKDAISISSFKAGMDLLYSKIEEQDAYYKKTVCGFATDLSKIWASPSAVAFSTYYDILIADYICEAHAYWNILIEDLTDAGKAWVEANAAEGQDVEFPYSFSTFDTETGLDPIPCETEIDGVSGMNVELVVPLMDNLFKMCEVYKYMVASVKDIDFAILDSKSEVSNSIDSAIDFITRNLDEELTGIKKIIEKDISDEKESVSLGAELAGKIMEDGETLNTRLSEIKTEIDAKNAAESTSTPEEAISEPTESPSVESTPAPITKPSNASFSSDRVAFF